MPARPKWTPPAPCRPFRRPWTTSARFSPPYSSVNAIAAPGPAARRGEFTLRALRFAPALLPSLSGECETPFHRSRGAAEKSQASSPPRSPPPPRPRALPLLFSTRKRYPRPSGKPPPLCFSAFPPRLRVSAVNPPQLLETPTPTSTQPLRALRLLRALGPCLCFSPPGSVTLDLHAKLRPSVSPPVFLRVSASPR